MSEKSNIDHDIKSTPAGPAHSKRRSMLSFAAGFLVAAAIFAWLLKGIIENWNELSPQLSQAPLWMLGTAVVIQLLFMFWVGLCYHNSLLLAGARIRLMHSLAVYLASQLGKYVPGKVLYVAGQIGLAKWLGVSLVQSFVGFAAHHVQLLAMGLMVASPLLGVVLGGKLAIFAIIAGALGFLFLLSGAWVKPFNIFQKKRGKPQLESFSFSYALSALLSAGLAWVSYGAIACALAVALAPGLGTDGLLRIAMASVTGWVLGFLIFITPSGMGVREGAFVLLSRSVIPEPIAMTIALLMRLLITFSQVPLGALALSYIIRAKREKARETSSASDEHI